MLLSELRKALNLGLPLVWNDPDPIEGNDYTINKIFDMPSPEEDEDEYSDDYILLIHYGEGSEAEVTPNEISLK